MVGNRYHGCQHRPWMGYRHRPRHVPWLQLKPGELHDSGQLSNPIRYGWCLQWHGPRAPTWPQVVAISPGIFMALRSNRGMDIDRVTAVVVSQTETWLLAAAQDWKTPCFWPGKQTFHISLFYTATASSNSPLSLEHKPVSVSFSLPYPTIHLFTLMTSL